MSEDDHTPQALARKDINHVIDRVRDIALNGRDADAIEAAKLLLDRGYGSVRRAGASLHGSVKAISDSINMSSHRMLSDAITINGLQMAQLSSKVRAGEGLTSEEQEVADKLIDQAPKLAAAESKERDALRSMSIEQLESMRLSDGSDDEK